MPIGEAAARHLLRRTEFVDRGSRVAALETKEVGPAVDDVLDASAPESLDIGTSPELWLQGRALSASWVHRMATASRPFGERMSLWWHGHLCTDLPKTRSGTFMREQVDLFRADGLSGDVGRLVKDMALQVAMLRYLDNDRNAASSPNQNFARELMELFLLGVGNYTEADVEAATASWTGWTADFDATTGTSAQHVRFDTFLHWRNEVHNPSIGVGANEPLRLLGQPINDSGTVYAETAGVETVDVILGAGTVPSDAEVVANRGRPSREVSAEFLSRKLWQEYGNGGPLPADFFDAGRVGRAMRDALLDNGFAIRPWVRAMLVHPDFYAEAGTGSLVRQPIEYAVALLRATAVRASTLDMWTLRRAGQEPLYPPNVSGWRPNGFWVNASAMEARSFLATSVVATVADRLDADGTVTLGAGGTTGTITTSHRSNDSAAAFTDRVIAAADLTATVRPATRDAVVSHLGDVARSRWLDALLLVLIAPEMHLA